MSTLAETFDTYAHQLDEKASQTRQVAQILKAGGGLAGVLGAVGMFGTGFGAIPLVIGAGMYAIGAGKEAATTGRFMPVPWSQESGSNIARNLIQEGDEEAVVVPTVTEFDYLSKDDKADYTLFGVMGPVVAQMLEGANEVQQERLLTQARRTLLKYHQDMIRDPELLAPHLFGSIQGARAAFAQNLPDELQAKVEPLLLAEVGEMERKPAKAPAVEPDVIEVEAVEEDALVADSGSKPTHNIPVVLSSVLRSTLVLGAPRCGKGYAVAMALQLLADNVSLWLIDPKNDPEESFYWEKVPADQRVRFDVNKILDPEDVTERVITLFERFLMASSSADKPKLLIIDECSPGLSESMIKAAYKRMMGKVATIASVGPSKGCFVWVISQATTAEDVGFSKANRASLRIAAVAHADKTEISWLESVRDTVGATMPAKALRGYLQMLGSEWRQAEPFEVAKPKASGKEPEDPPAPAPAKKAPDVRSQLNSLLDAPLVIEPLESEVKGISESRGWISASDVKRYSSRASELRNMDNSAIRDIFQSLTAEEVGSLQGEGDRIKWKA